MVSVFASWWMVAGRRGPAGGSHGVVDVGVTGSSAVERIFPGYLGCFPFSLRQLFWSMILLFLARDISRPVIMTTGRRCRV